MTDPAESAVNGPEQHKVDIGNNPALIALYGLGGSAAGLGLLTVIISSALLPAALDPTGALAWQSLGSATTAFGFTGLIAAMVAHAVNWQIGRISR